MRKHGFILSAEETAKTVGCRVVNIHMSLKNCLCILKKYGYGVLSLTNMWWEP